MSERVQPRTIYGDIETIIGGLDPDLGEFLQKVDANVVKYRGRLVSSALPTILYDLITIRSASIEEIRNSTRISGVIEPKIGKSNKAYDYGREDILAFSTVCWYIDKSFAENGSFDEEWVDIVGKTKDLLGGDNAISSRLKIPDDPNSGFSTGSISYEVFTSGARTRASKNGDPIIKGKEPHELTAREVSAELSGWDLEMFRNLLDSIPDSIDSIDSIPMMREVPASIIEKLITVYDLNQGNDFTLRRVKDDAVSAALLKTAIRDYLGLAEFSKQMGEPHDISSIVGVLMRLRHA